MNILLADDERLALAALESAVRKAAPDAHVYAFQKTGDLLEFAAGTPCDVAFLDIEMCGINGIELAKQLKDRTPAINIIFVTGHAEYMGDAFGLHASGYILKPAVCETVREELNNLRNPVVRKSAKLRVQTFGNFEVFDGEEVLHFGRAKSKELFAYLIDRRGTTVTMAEIAAVLWEDKAYNRSQLRQIHTFLSDAKHVLTQAGHTDVLVKKRNSIAVNTAAVDCDYYQFLQGDVPAINSFTGEYMTNYAWAEFTVGNLFRLSKNNT